MGFHKSIFALVLAFLALGTGVPLDSATAQIKTLPEWQKPLPVPPESHPLSLEQMIEVGIGSLRPAYYLIRPTNAQMCLSQAPGGLLERPHLKLATCNPSDQRQLFAIVQFDANQYATIHSAGRLEGTNLVECAKAARGVVFGPSRVDLLPCTNDDERDHIEIAWHPTRSAFRIFHHKEIKEINSELRAEMHYKPFCWAMRGAGNSEGTDVILWPCEEGAEQFFDIVEIRQLERDILHWDRIQYSKWWWHSDGYRRPFQAEGISLGGIDYAAFETSNDTGSYCMRRCLESPECKAYMWTSPDYEAYLGAQGKRVPMCHLKSNAGTPLFRGANYRYLVRSGIIRPR